MVEPLLSNSHPSSDDLGDKNGGSRPGESVDNRMMYNYIQCSFLSIAYNNNILFSTAKQCLAALEPRTGIN